MFKTFLLILKNLGRNRTRTVLTSLAVVVLVATYSGVSAVTNKIESFVSSKTSLTRLSVRERWVLPSRFPRRYVDKIASMDGVLDWTVWHFFVGRLPGSKATLTGIGTRVEGLRVLGDDYAKIDPSAVEWLAREKTGVLVGPSALRLIGREVGQTFTVDAAMHPGKSLELKIVGVLEGDLWAQTIVFLDDYYRQALDEEDSVNLMWIETGDRESAERLAAEIEAAFVNSPAELQVETESASTNRISGRAASIVNVINLVAAVLLVDILLVLSNSIGITVRERRKEMAILKVLGFKPRTIVAMVVGEAALVGGVSGFAGGLLAFSASEAIRSGMLPPALGILAMFPVSFDRVPECVLIGAAVGAASSVMPAWSVQKISPADVFASQNA